MKKSASDKTVAQQTTSGKSGASASPVVFPQTWVVREIADTTWRMTVPVVIFAFIGIFCDLKFQTKPWFTLLGTAIGFYFASMLVRKQINRSKEVS